MSNSVILLANSNIYSNLVGNLLFIYNVTIAYVNNVFDLAVSKVVDGSLKFINE